MAADPSELCFMTISQAGPLIRDRKLSPLELVGAFLERIERLDGQLNSFITLLPEESLLQARAAESDVLHRHDS